MLETGTRGCVLQRPDRRRSEARRVGVRRSQSYEPRQGGTRPAQGRHRHRARRLRGRGGGADPPVREARHHGNAVRHRQARAVAGRKDLRQLRQRQVDLQRAVAPHHGPPARARRRHNGRRGDGAEGQPVAPLPHAPQRRPVARGRVAQRQAAAQRAGVHRRGEGPVIGDGHLSDAFRFPGEDTIVASASCLVLGAWCEAKAPGIERKQRTKHEARSTKH